LRRTIEHRVLGVDMQVDERILRHQQKPPLKINRTTPTRPGLPSLARAPDNPAGAAPTRDI
ncbi:hypothetical protein, partial [Amycolatopsis anabasis]|uniref:hypothetical protein n=1 Tax=Amycolatopsis anabasis TaxID=1840409 RepID=UPI001C55278B